MQHISSTYARIHSSMPGLPTHTTQNAHAAAARAVFDVLYMLIGHGHESEESALRLDPPDDFFRVRLVS